MIKLTLDGIEVAVAEGESVLYAADRAEIYIPRLCAHPELPSIDPEKLEPSEAVFLGTVSVGPDASVEPRFEGCLLCLVEVEGENEPLRACATEVREGMRVRTATPEIEARRRASIRRIFSTHPHSCVQCAQRTGCALDPCSTNVAKEERCCPLFHVCELRKVAEFVGIPDDTARYRPAGLPIVEDEPLFLRDHNLCVGCLRCVRVCRDVRKVDALGFVIDGSRRPIMGVKAATLRDAGCRFCLSCVEVCPTGALRLKFEDPRAAGTRVTRCAAACPAGMDVPRYLREIRRGEFGRAEAVIREAAPLPRVLGQVCFHPCEEECLRTDLSQPVAICSLKRAAVEHAEAAVWKSRLDLQRATGKRVGIIGAGPAGLTAAWFLRLKGHEVILFDALPSPGGWLHNGIPEFRLSRDACHADIAEIVGIGIDLRMGVEIGREIGFEEIRSSHDAVLIAAGARSGKRLACEGVELPGVESGLDVLQRHTADGGAERRRFRGETIVVIGGGNVAIDVARTARRLGPREVHLYCLELRDTMPAHEWEIVEAQREGIVIHPGWGPVRIAGEGKVSRVDFRRCTEVLDREGRFAPRFDEETAICQEADRVLVAIGQEASVGFLDRAGGPALSASGYLQVDRETLETSLAGVFAAGEVISGPASVIQAVAQGRRAAAGIDRRLGGDGEIGVSLLDQTVLDGELGPIKSFADLERRPVPRLPVDEAVGSFDLVETGYAPTDARDEAERCLRCDLRFRIRPVAVPPEPWLAFTEEQILAVPETGGVYQLLDESKVVYAIKGVENLRASLSGILGPSKRAKFFLFEQDPMYSKRESELIQEYLREHGCMPPGEGEDGLDDLF